MGIAHWDEVSGTLMEAGDVECRWQDLGTAAGSREVGLRRFWIAPGKRSNPVHRHGAEEEVFVLIAGGGRLWQNGRTYAVAEGDVILHRRRAEAHTLAAGPDGLHGLVFGTRVWVESIELPRADVAWLRPTWTEIGKGKHPLERERRAGPLVELDDPPQPERPENVTALADIDRERREHGSHGWVQRRLGLRLPFETCGLREHVIDPGRRGPPLHCHSSEEELFVVLEGSGELELSGEDAEERLPVSAGHVVARPAASGIAHGWRASPERPLRMLAFGQRRPEDLCYYPRSRKVAFRGLGLMTRIEGGLEYWDGED